MTITERIDTILKERGISRRKLAQMAGIPPSSLQSAMERGTIVSIDMLEKIAKALSIPVMSIAYEKHSVDFPHLLGDDSAPVEDQQLLCRAMTSDLRDQGEIGHYFADRIQRHFESIFQDRIIKVFNSLNDEGQKKAIERMEELAEIPKYRRTKND